MGTVADREAASAVLQQSRPLESGTDPQADTRGAVLGAADREGVREALGQSRDAARADLEARLLTAVDREFAASGTQAADPSRRNNPEPAAGPDLVQEDRQRFTTLEATLENRFSQELGGGRLAEDQRAIVFERFYELRHHDRVAAMGQEIDAASRSAAQDAFQRGSDQIDVARVEADIARIAGRFHDLRNPGQTLEQFEQTVISLYTAELKQAHGTPESRTTARGQDAAEANRRLRDLVERQAEEDYTRGGNPQALEAALKQAIEQGQLKQYSHLITSEQLQATLEQYKQRCDAKWDDLGFIKKGYYKARNWVSGAWDDIKDFGSSIIDSGFVQGVVTIGKGLKNIAVEGAKLLYTREGWSKIGAAASKVWEFATSEKTWEMVGKGLSWLGDKLSDPQAWLAAGRWVVGKTVDLAVGVGRFAYTMVTDPAEGLRQLWTGVKTVGTFIWEGTGVPDLYRALDAAARGDWASFALHGSFAAMSIGSIVATVATGGAAAGSMVGVAAGRMTVQQAVRATLSTAAKEFLKTSGKEIGERIVKEVGSELATAAARAGRAVADDMAKELGERVLREGAGALTGEAVESLGHQFGKQHCDTLMKELGITDRVHAQVSELLIHTRDLKPKALRKELEELGLDAAKAKETAKDLKKLIRDRRFDHDATRELTESISDPIRRQVEEQMKPAYENQFRRHLLGQEEGSEALTKALREQAERAGKTAEQLADEYVERGWRGVQRGIRESVEEAVERGVKRAFDDLRRPRLRPRGSAAEAKLGAVVAGSGVVLAAEEEGIQAPAKPRAEEAPALGGQRTETVVVERDGQRITRVYVGRGTEGAKLELVSESSESIGEQP